MNKEYDQITSQTSRDADRKTRLNKFRPRSLIRPRRPVKIDELISFTAQEIGG